MRSFVSVVHFYTYDFTCFYMRRALIFPKRSVCLVGPSFHNNALIFETPKRYSHHHNQETYRYIPSNWQEVRHDGQYGGRTRDL
jgi:hypothetical protein